MFPLYPWTDYSKQNKGLKWLIDKLTHLKAKDVEYDNDTSGLDAENVQDAIDELQNEIENIGPGGSPSAADVSYDNSDSGLEADTVQEAIDELAEGGGGSYTLPIATDTRLGGIKVGARLTIDPETGVLSADDQTQPEPEPNWNVRYFDNEDGSDDNDGLTSATPKKTLSGVLGTASDYINIVVINQIGTGYPMRVLEISNDTLGTSTFTKHIKVTPLYTTNPYKLKVNTTIAETAALIVRNTETDLSGIYNTDSTLDLTITNNGLLDIRGGKEFVITNNAATNNPVTIGTGETGTTILRDLIFSSSGSWNGNGKLIEFLKCVVVFTGSSGDSLLKTRFGSANIGEGREYPPAIVFVQNTRFINSSGYFPTGCYFASEDLLVYHQNDNVATYGLPSTAFKSNFSIN